MKLAAALNRGVADAYPQTDKLTLTFDADTLRRAREATFPLEKRTKSFMSTCLLATAFSDALGGHEVIVGVQSMTDRTDNVNYEVDTKALQIVSELVSLFDNLKDAEILPRLPITFTAHRRERKPL